MAPLDPALLDAQLSSLIHTYTLRGAALLIHCRGGVGRAGLLACCWMLKLGLCGPLAAEGARTLQLVEKAIAAVRRRRSLKAVETYEQVRFLVDFVEYLRARADADAVDDMDVDWDVQID